MSKRIYSKKSEKLEKSAEKAWHHGLKAADRHEVGLLQEKLRRDHTDIVTRCALLGFYSSPKHDGKPHLWCENFEWLIMNCPDEKLMANTNISRIPVSVSSEQFEQLQAEFLQKVDRNRKNANVTGHAAHFIFQRNKKLALALFKKARRLAPDDQRWNQHLLSIYNNLAKDGNDQKLATKAFKVADRLIKDLRETKSHGWYATRMCELALFFDDLENAKKYVKKVKRSEFDRECPWCRHQLLGMIALKESSVDRAKQQLLKSASKGDNIENLQLANQLIQRGELSTAIEYLQHCLSHDKNKRYKKLIDGWIEQLQEGKKISIK